MKAVPTSSDCSALTTVWPSPGASISAAMVTIDSAAMMVWLIADHDGALGHRQQHLDAASARRVEPERRPPPRRSSRGTCRMPCAVIRIDRRGRVDERGDRRRGRADEEEQGQRREVDERRHGLHEVEDRRDDRVDPVGQSRPRRPAGCRRAARRAPPSASAPGCPCSPATGPAGPKKTNPADGQQRRPASCRAPRRRSPTSADDAEPADQRQRPVDGRLGDQRLHEASTSVVDDEADLVEEVEEERVGVAVGADRVVDVVEPACAAA